MFDDIRSAIWNFMKSRTFFLMVVFIILFSILLQRVFYLQIVRGGEYQDSFVLKTEKQISLSSTRGNIYDRNGKLLAYSELSYSVTIEDNGSYVNNNTKNAKLNETIYRLIQLVERNGDSTIHDFGILYENGRYVFSQEGTALLRFKADVYGHPKISELKASQELATPDEMMEYLCGEKNFGLPDSYTEEEKKKYGISVDGYTPEEKLKILNIRNAMFSNNYRRYVATTVATGVSQETVAAVLENQDTLQGVDIAQSSIRVYPESKYFASIIGYIGKASQEELDELQLKDETYELNDIIGKSGIEQYMELELQGTKGHETMYVDRMGKVLEVTESVMPVPGNDLYLTIDADLNIAVYRIIEQELAGILLSKIRNMKEYIPGERDGPSSILIPIYDIYNAMIANNILDSAHFREPDATELEKSVYERLKSRRESVLSALEAQLMADHPLAYKDLSKEMQNYMSYVVSDVLMGDNQVLMQSQVNTSDETYIRWTKEEVISLKEYLQYAISMNWIDVTRVASDNPYMNSQEIYEAVLDFIRDYLETDSAFEKMLYKYMLLDDVLTGSEICLLLYDQNVLEYNEELVTKLQNGSLSAYTFMTDRIRELSITPGQLALDPCSAGCVITDVNTGDVLALVDYPGYDNNRLTNTVDAAYFNQLLKDSATPFVNRAAQETTAPGSTFKPLAAIAGLEEGVITTTETIATKGLYDTVTPSKTCWIYTQYGGSHGGENVTTAIRDSCNYFFYEVGYRLSGGKNGSFSNEKGLAVFDKYAHMFGLGDPSGVEISERSPQISDELPIDTAIGQGTNNYTLTQLVRYVTALANEGTCYNITLLDKLTDSEGQLVEDYQADIFNQVELNPETWNAVRSGMRLMAENNKTLQSLGISMAGKTGTAEQSKRRPNHALFVGFAPYDQPEIAIATRIANGYTSSNCVEISAEVLKYYYDLEDEETLITGVASEATNVTILD
ncbi:MAG: hypothetical protein HFI30_04855 [Lachnospiraceae bacterium]|nr:hypothetical protein [Lachnospiraceae bacterium]MCI8995003.1 hypothetical protein [Lachnospiraceae bacterium]